LTVPCCIKCNTGFLSSIESSVQSIFQRGFVISEGEELCLARWLSKILIGIVVKETSLAFDRSKPEAGQILKPGIIDELRHCHFVMQSARKPTSFHCLHGRFPFSLYAYKIADSEDESEFDLSTNFFGQSISIRVGRLGAVFINDGGLQMEVGPKGPYGLAGEELSKVQFKEISARIHYKSALRDATHFYLTSETEDRIQVDQLKVTSFSGYLPASNELRIFSDWNEIDFGYAMAAYMGADRSEIFDEESQTCKTTLGKLIAERAKLPTSSASQN
jgi:hypothetical protein